MKNLIEDKYLECEKELKININLSVEDVMFIKGKMEAYMSILQSLKDYNLITAPKYMKWSELVEKLKEQNPYADYIVGKTYSDEKALLKSVKWGGSYRTRELISFNKNGTIKDIELYMNEYKWLFELWIAGTEIIDDMEEKE